MLMVVFSSLFLPLLPKFCLFYLLQAQFHYSWCRTRHSFGVAVIGRLLFFLEELGHQAGLANLLLLLLLGGLHFHHAFTVLFFLWVCLQGSFWIF